MNHEFTVDEIKQAARAARIYSQDFSEEKFESLMELARRIDESDYLETVRGMYRLETEKGVSITQILDACQELLKSSEQLEIENADLELRLKNLGDMIQQAEHKYSQLQESINKAEEVLGETITWQKKETRQLKTFQNKAEAEKQRIAEEIEDYHQKANINREEVIAAGQIKAEVEKHGFTLELALSLAKEFAGHNDARERLAAGLKKHGSLTGYLNELEKWGEGQRATLVSEMSRLESQKKQLIEGRIQLETAVAQLREDEAAEQELRRFYRRFFGLGGVLEQLAKWKQVYALRCNNPFYSVAKPFNPSAGCARIWTDKTLSPKCPFCGQNTLEFDAEVYTALGIPVGLPLKIILGE